MPRLLGHNLAHRTFARRFTFHQSRSNRKNRRVWLLWASLFLGYFLTVAVPAAEPAATGPTVQFREPHGTKYRLETNAAALAGRPWIKAWRSGETNSVEL